jgi:hypothetical protein
MRDNISPDNFQFILNFVKFTGFIQARKRTAFILCKIEVMQKARIQAKQHKEERQKATKQVMKDNISPNNFQFILNLIKFIRFVLARKKLPLFYFILLA